MPKNLVKSLSAIFKLFLYRDTTSEYTQAKEDEIDRIEEKIRFLEKNLTNKILSKNTSLIHNEIENYINNNLEIILDNRLKSPDLINRSVLKSLNSEISSEINKKISQKSLKELQEDSSHISDIDSKHESHQSLMQMLERESKSASMLKMVMINLFVVSTLAFLVFNIFNRVGLPENSYYAILGIYFSLGAFMLYIIRTSHYRSSILIAIKEDERNFHHSLDYVKNVRGGEGPTENDIDLIRLIMTNRAERENKANHPYEVILKSVSGTNIQFKGGKINLGSKNKSDA